MGSRTMMGAAVLSAVSTAFTTAVSWREPGLPDEPFGIRFPGDVRTHLVLGLGSGVAAPWPMPLIALAAAARAPTRGGGAERTCAVIGATMLVGTVAEPASWGIRPRSRAARATVVLNLLSGAALFWSGTTAAGR